ncbi:hypothetical protein CH304_18285 [Rhodococcus sp. 15-649-1-2]|uniref:MarR family winged helix-turn-helix transcriptional regulator n=1 Tax=Nocardiaceae TaxID=85025 RepID=UPI00036226E8|nr:MULTISPECIES: MarR family transcriptional regulator [Rhodococcus]OZC50814.1 hypothetical protein CH267_22440 [Rhodococcus sp. 06-621-2]OZD11101.1 hypothetical protein CH280_20420 [Rhodococcus sp. 06-156-4C]OZD14517.1 hypothetical protein CH248_24495 [Rhodococcus sp. 06-156-4a]OZD24851.1 hypothetical protein CH253_05265 [Rhodococcus sp. 06-156-3C]OZD27825.1 hypothetical protein CH247_21405 [Rhodococcus sp. 06-156-3b]
MTTATDTRADSMETIATLLRNTDAVKAQLEESLARVGLNWARFEILRTIGQCGPMTYEQICRRLARHRTTIRVTVAGLERAGLVERYRDSAHSQRLLVALTSSGERTVERANTVIAQCAVIRRVDSDVELTDAVSSVEGFVRGVREHR